MRHRLTLTAVGVILVGGATAQAEVFDLQIIDDFGAATVFRPFLPGFDDRAAITDQARFQVNGDETGSTGTLGIFTVFDIDGSFIRPAAGAQAINDITVDLFPAVNNETGTGGIANAGDLSIYFTTTDVDVLDPASGIEFDNGGGTDPTGLGDQFDNLTLLSSEFEEAGINDISRSLDTSSINSLLLDRINAGENVRFILASQTPGFTSNFGTGNPDDSDIFDFFGDPATISVDVAPVPSPGAFALFGVAAAAGTRRRHVGSSRRA